MLLLGGPSPDDPSAERAGWPLGVFARMSMASPILTSVQEGNLSSYLCRTAAEVRGLEKIIRNERSGRMRVGVITDEPKKRLSVVATCLGTRVLINW